MAEDNSGRRDRKLGLVAPVSIAAVLVLVVVGALVYREGGEATKVAPKAPPPAVAPPQPEAEPPAADAVLGRADLLRDAASVTAAFAAGEPGAPRALAGKRFTIRIPFGCDGPQVGAGTAQAFYEYDPQKRTVRLVARPAVWTTLPAIPAGASETLESVEGFWIPRPWTPSEDCPRRREQPFPATPTSPAAPTLGLAQLFAAGAARTARHAERPYEHVLKLEAGATPPLARGYRLRLEGRFGVFPNGAAASCWSESPDHRPVCLYAVELDRVAFEDAGGGLIAEWRN